MLSTNYIKHLSHVYLLISEDAKLNPTRVSLYMALFQLWNLNRFHNPFYINRAEVMRLSKIGSKSTYHKCLRDLDAWSYIVYHPSHNPLKGSKIELYRYECAKEQRAKNKSAKKGQVVGQLLRQDSPKIGQVLGQALVSTININKHNQTIKEEKPRSKKKVLEFFKKNLWPQIEAEKFHSYYASLNWKIKGVTKMYDWKAAATNWMCKAYEFNENLNQKENHLKVSKNKNYNEPL